MGCPGIFLSIVLVLFSSSDQTGIQGESFSLFFEEGMDGLASRLAETYPRVAGDVEAMLGFSYDGKASLHLVRGNRSFQRLTGMTPLSWMAAVALPARGIMILRVEKLTNLRQDILIGTLKHEYCHLVAGRALQSSPLIPKWFSEGLAQWTADMLFMGRAEEFEIAASLNNLISFYDLVKRFPREPSRISLAYLQSESLVRFMEKLYGRPALQEILSRMAQGSGFYEAHTDVTGEGFPDLVKQWKSSLRGVGFLHILFAKAYPFLILAAGLALLAFLHRRVKDARIRKRWEEEGEAEQEDDNLD